MKQLTATGLVFPVGVRVRIRYHKQPLEECKVGLAGRNLIWEVDSIYVVNVLTNNAKDEEINLIRKPQDYLKEWYVVIKHVYGEDNKLVDDLTSMAWRQTLQSAFYYSPQVALLD
ncbi:hypothetical protein Golob_023720 [Gossypium lobatum]|uniref:RNase H type-1 domain-containing protein n=1 Tax=Gossypium lobatum TaxID=34289 RepID=A0A7J8LKJ1_9ROSI|nr:hypothetical protein [Gossypium lobatum]